MKELPKNLLSLIMKNNKIASILLPRQSRYAWETNNFNDGALFLYSIVKFLKPRLIIELGTFEGHGTLILSQATQHTKRQIYTIDCDNVIENKHPDFEIVSKARSENIRNAHYKNSGHVKFINGETRAVLNQLLPKLKKIDFVFQDSMHSVPGLLEEFDLVRSYLSKFAVIIFDDWWMVKLKHLYLLPYLKGRFSPNKTHNPLKGPLDMSFNWYEVNRGKGFLVGQRVS